MVTTLKYDQLVQKLLDDGRCVSRSEARRHVSLSEREEGNKGKEFIPAAGSVPDPKRTPLSYWKATGQEPPGYVTKSGRVYKSKPGRKPKDAKA